MNEDDFKDIKKIMIIGLGLMGGSFAKSIRKNGYAGEIYGFDLSDSTMEFAIRKKIIDKDVRSLDQNLSQIDMIVIATPVGKYKRVLNLIKDSIKKGTIITDLGSVKNIYEDLKDLLPKDCSFVGAHPMAGSEKSGIENSREDLFDGKNIFISQYSNQDGIEEVEQIMKMTMANVIRICPKIHDKATAITSHIPHLSAAILVEIFKDMNIKDSKSFIGQGFIDSTRIASSEPEVWKDIFIANKEMIEVIDEFQKKLESFKLSIVNGEENKILNRLSKIKKSRDQIFYT